MRSQLRISRLIVLMTVIFLPFVSQTPPQTSAALGPAAVETYRIERGTATPDWADDPQGYATRVDFAVPFATPPTVVITPVYAAPFSTHYPVAFLTEVAQTHFLFIMRTDAGPLVTMPHLSWIAIGAP